MTIEPLQKSTGKSHSSELRQALEQLTGSEQLRLATAAEAYQFSTLRIKLRKQKQLDFTSRIDGQHVVVTRK